MAEKTPVLLNLEIPVSITKRRYSSHPFSTV